MPLSQGQLAEMAKEAVIDGKEPPPVVCLAKKRRTLRTSIVTFHLVDPATGICRRVDHAIEEYLDTPLNRWRRQSTVAVGFKTVRSVVITTTDFPLM